MDSVQPLHVRFGERPRGLGGFDPVQNEPPDAGGHPAVQDSRDLPSTAGAWVWQVVPGTRIGHFKGNRTCFQ